MGGGRLTRQRCSGNYPGVGGCWAEQGVGAGRGGGPGGHRGWVSALYCPAWQRRCGPGLCLTRSSQCIFTMGAVQEFQSGGGHDQYAQNFLSWVETALEGTGEAREALELTEAL